MELNNLNKIIQETQDAINHIDDIKAREILKEITNVISNSQNQINQDSRVKLEDLKTKLEIVAFPNLPDEIAENVLRNHYFKSFDIGVDMKNRLTAKLFFVPEIPRDELRKKLQKAILENNEQFGQLTVGQWLREFEKMFNVHTRDRSAPVRFVMEHPHARALSEADKAKLKEIIYTYDYLLVSTLPATGPVLEEILNSSMAEIKRTKEPDETMPVIAPVRVGREEGSHSFYEPLIQRRTTGFPSGTSEEITDVINIPLSQALQKYPRLGEQLVTGNPIKLKIFPDPVRPSVKNWIAEYHAALGAGSHGTMERGNFLYHSENARRLSFGERQKLAVILKSLDENEAVAVDAEKQEVIFNLQPATGNLQQTTSDRNPKSQVPTRLPDGQVSNKNPNPNDQKLNWQPRPATSDQQPSVKFSSPQRLQSEPPPPPVPPSSSRPEPRIEGNTVDLRG